MTWSNLRPWKATRNCPGARGAPGARLVTAAILAVAAMLLFAGVASAHAAFVRSEPAAGSVLRQSPREVSIWFTEPVEGRGNEIRVLDRAGNRVDNNDSAPDPRDAKRLSVTLRALPDGAYTVSWRVVSGADGHDTRGGFVFTVGEPATVTAPTVATAPPQAAAAPPLFSSPFDPWLKWISLISAMALLGGLGFFLLVAEPVMRKQPAAASIRARVYALVLAASAVLFLACIASLAAYTSVVEQLSLPQAIGRPLLDVLTGTRWGDLLLWRMALLAATVVAVAIPFLSSRRRKPEDSADRGGERFWFWLALAFAAEMLATFSLMSHNAGLTDLRTQGVMTDYLHLLAAAFWVGGLFHLAFSVPGLLKSTPHPGPVLAAMVPRFSVMAVLSVGTLLITGLYSSWVSVGTLPAVFGTAYGWSLVAKVALIVPLLTFGALNLLRVGPNLSRSAGAGYLLRRFVSIEAVLAATVLLAVGMLTNLETARQAYDEGTTAQQSISLTRNAQDLTVNLRIEPGYVGENRLVVSLKDRSGRPVKQASSVSLLLKYSNADLGETPVTAVAQPDGTFAVDKKTLSVAGAWQAVVEVQRPGSFDAAAVFQVDISPGSRVAPAPKPDVPSADTGRLLWGLEIGALAALFAGVGVLKLAGRFPGDKRK